MFWRERQLQRTLLVNVGPKDHMFTWEISLTSLKSRSKTQLTRPHGRAAGDFKVKHSLPIQTKVEASFNVKRGKKKPETFQDMPLKRDFTKDIPEPKRLRKKVEIFHQPSNRIERGKKTFVSLFEPASPTQCWEGQESTFNAETISHSERNVGY